MMISTEEVFWDVMMVNFVCEAVGAAGVKRVCDELCRCEWSLEWESVHRRVVTDCLKRFSLI